MPARTGRSIALDESLLILQEGLEALGETRLIQDGERVRPHVPLFQAADHDGPRRQVDHCAGTEGGDELAEALRILGHQRSSAFAMGWPRGSRILRATLGSTSRILRRRRPARRTVTGGADDPQADYLFSGSGTGRPENHCRQRGSGSLHEVAGAGRPRHGILSSIDV